MQLLAESGDIVYRMEKARTAATLGISLLVVALVAAFAMSVANVAYAQTSKPAKVTVTYAKSKKAGSVTVKWEKVRGAGKYTVLYAYSSKFKGAKSKSVSAKKTSATLSAKSGKTVYLRVKAIKKKVSGKYSKTVKVKVKAKTSAVAPVLKKDGLYHCAALKYGYRLYTGITDKLYSKCDTAIYLKTKSPSDVFRINFYDKDGKNVNGSTVASSYSDVNRGSLSMPHWTGSYHRVSGGYIAVNNLYRTAKNRSKVYPTGAVTVKVQEKTGYGYTREMKVGTIKLQNTDALKKAWLNDILEKSGANRESTGEAKMQAICTYLRSHTTYSRCYNNTSGNVSYIYTIADLTTPSFAQMSYNSYTSPAELEYIGKQIGYPVRSEYGDYASGTSQWYFHHSYAIHESDQKEFAFCSETETGQISDKVLTKDQALDLIPQLKVKSLHPVSM